MLAFICTIHTCASMPPAPVNIASAVLFYAVKELNEVGLTSVASGNWQLLFLCAHAVLRQHKPQAAPRLRSTMKDV
jgi:hypothetical protein